MHQPTKILISEFDVELFRKLSQYYLTARMIYELLPTFEHQAGFNSFPTLQLRLKKLYQAGYINRDYRLSRGQGANEYYYFLTKRGARFFEDLMHLKPARSILKRLELGHQEHSFMISEFMLKLEKDVWQTQGQMKLSAYIRENFFEIQEPQRQREMKQRSLKPDGTIFLERGTEKSLLFLEADLSTQPVNSANPYRSSFRKKIEIYSAFKHDFQQNNLVHLFGPLSGFRVLTVCKSPQRVASLLDVAQQLGKEKMFWFTYLDQVQQQNVLFSPMWSLPNGSQQSLFSSKI